MSKKVSRKDSDKVSVIWHGMSRKEHRHINKYIQCMAATLGLREWKILLCEEFTAEDGNEDALATLDIIPGRHVAHMRLAKDFNSYPYKEKKQAIIHELVHCHQLPLLVWADDTLRDVLGTVGYAMFNAAYRDNFENMVDDLAVVFSRLLDDSSIKHLLKGN